MSLITRVVLAAAMSLAALAGAMAADTPRRGGTLNFAVVAEPPNYDCHGTVSFAVMHPIAPHYSLLVKFDAQTYPKIVGDLAESWTVSPDQLTYTFKVRSGVKFHDGSPFTAADVKATYERLSQPPEGVLSIRKAQFSDITSIETPDDTTVVFKLKAANASMLQNFASPFNCIYSAAKLKQNPKYPETEILGTGPFTFVEHVRGASWAGKRFEGYFRQGHPYLDGYKALFVKSSALVNGMLGGQYDTEFRTLTPSERELLLAKDKEKWVTVDGPSLIGMVIIFNMTKKPFDDIRIRHALSLAVDRWGGAEALSKISVMKYVGGVMRTGYEFALSADELAKLPGFGHDIEAARVEARRLLKEAGAENLKLKLLNRNVADPYTAAGVFLVDQWRRIGVAVEQQQLESKQYFDGLNSGSFEIAINPLADPADDPNLQFSYYLTQKASPLSYARHSDEKIDKLYEGQSRALDPAERKKISNELETYILQQSYSTPFLWWQRIVAHRKNLHGYVLTPSQFVGQDLSELWLGE